jgi:hypothetical protein
VSTVSPASRRTSTPHRQSRADRSPAVPASDAIIAVVKAMADQTRGEIRGRRDPAGVLDDIAQQPTVEESKQRLSELQETILDFEGKAVRLARRQPQFAHLSWPEKQDVLEHAARIGRAESKRLEDHVDRVLERRAERRARAGVVDPSVEWLGWTSYGRSPSHRQRKRAEQILQIATEAAWSTTGTLVDQDDRTRHPVRSAPGTAREDPGRPPQPPADRRPRVARRTRRAAQKTVLHSVVLRLRDGARVPAVAAIVDRRSVLALIEVNRHVIDEQQRIGYLVPVGTEWRAYRRRDVLGFVDRKTVTR